MDLLNDQLKDMHIMPSLEAANNLFYHASQTVEDIWDTQSSYLVNSGTMKASNILPSFNHTNL
ncbi:hypothetical protein FRB91_007782 [Serendipita sp. 411]|nr:hypothetical protein FRC20_007945 [Serendipita sp. 405]KAG8838108.1 hypothetical protein FRB91_007782 [Serendipita sp. 411]